MTGVFRVFVVTGCCILLTGCGEGRDELVLAPADGTVTYQGKPVVDANVTFAPEKGAVAFGVTNMEGKFKLTTGTRNGAVVGPVKVTVSLPSADDSGSADISAKVGKTAEETMANMNKAWQEHYKKAAESSKKKSLIPEKYSKTDTSGLSYTIKANGNNHFAINLE